MRRIATVSLLAVIVAAGCVSVSRPAYVENLDPVTGTTVVTIGDPLQLVTQQPRGSGHDPFAFLAPFDIDRMGKRALFLWVAVPEDGGAVQSVQVLCDGQALALAATSLDLAAVGLGRAPYRPPAPWSHAWYFALPDEALARLGSSAKVVVIAQAQAGGSDQYQADSGALRALSAFATRHSGGS